MIDYLAPENITVTNAIDAGVLTPEAVRDAVFKLWLEPNDTKARSVLILYVRYGKNSGEGTLFEIEGALRSRMISRIARGIHRYDRYNTSLLTFLIRNLINAFGDLHATRLRLRDEPKKRGPKPKPAPMPAPMPSPKPAPDTPKKPEAPKAPSARDEAATAVNIAAKKLGVAPEQLGLLLAKIRKRITEDEGKVDYDEMAAELGIDVDRLEAFLCGKPVGRRGSSRPISPRPNIARSALNRSGSVRIETVRYAGEASGAVAGQDKLIVVSEPDRRYIEYLDKLSAEKPLGEKVFVKSRRLVEIEGKNRVVEVQTPPLQMSEAELLRALKAIDVYRDDIERFKKPKK